MVPKFNILNWTYLGYYTNISRYIAISIAIQLAALILLVQYGCRMVFDRISAEDLPTRKPIFAAGLVLKLLSTD